MSVCLVMNLSIFDLRDTAIYNWVKGIRYFWCLNQVVVHSFTGKLLFSDLVSTYMAI